MKILARKHIGTQILGLVLLITVLSCKNNSKGHRFTNALADETSPYLLQHAHNPVNWQPWSDDLWEEATKANKLVVISIGYASCHWCHVMEEETFEDEAVAQVMNEKYISVKVDREERPDVDQVYMTALQLLTGNGGWPLNIIATPEGKPLYGGTYHTKDEWMQVLTELDSLYHADPGKASEFADRVAQGVQAANQIISSRPDQDLNPTVVATAVQGWKPLWDTLHGGMSGTEKFMIPGNLEFLLAYSNLVQAPKAEKFLATTLDRMARGGIYDQIGGGFFRYSTDPRWRIPHFEKMLYDNAQAIGLYANAYRNTPDPQYKSVIEETIAFLDRDLSNSQGAYYAALDADSEGKEGLYYIWEEKTLKDILNDEFSTFANYYGVQAENKWDHNSYVLFVPKTLDSIAKETAMEKEVMAQRIMKWRDTLLTVRNSRIKPGVDDKIITSWNALLISGLVNASQALDNPAYLQKAEDVFSFLMDHAYDSKGLRHTYKPNAKYIPGFLEDYALMTSAAIDLYLATMKADYLETARKMHTEAVDQFAIPDDNMFRYTRNKELIATIVKTDDGVIPSPNAVMAHNFFRLGHIAYNKDYLNKAREMVSIMQDRFSETPYNYAGWGRLLLQHVHPYFEIAIVGEEASELLKGLQSRYMPNALILGTTVASDDALFENRYVQGETLIYVCRNTTCKMPVNTIEAALEQVANW